MGPLQTVQAGFVAGGVDGLMVGGGVVLFRPAELFPKRKDDVIHGGTVAGPVSLDVLQGDVLPVQIAGQDALGFLDGLEAGGEVRFLPVVLLFHALALGDVEDVVVTEHGDKLLLPVLVLHGNLFPEHADAGLLALADMASGLLTLLVGQVLSGLAQEKLIQEAVGLSGGAAPGSVSHADPGLFPGDAALLQLGNDAVCDHFVDVHRHD